MVTIRSFTPVAASLVLFQHLAAAVKLWEKPADIPSTVRAACRAALVHNFQCDTLVTSRVAMDGGALVPDIATAYCNKTCTDSIIEFQTKVNKQCGNDLLPLYHDSNLKQSALELANSLVWAQRLTCIQDETGYCLSEFYAGRKPACSDCALKWGSVMVSSDYGRVKMPPDDFNGLLSTCSKPTASYPWTYTPPAVPTSTTRDPPTSTSLVSCAGTEYTVKVGDSCKSIAHGASISLDNMIAYNRLDFNCTTLVPGLKLCLKDACKLYTVKKGDTCKAIIGDGSYEMIQLTSWNPVIYSDCGNIDALVGRSICVSPPGGGNFSYSPIISSVWQRPTLSSPMFTSWESAEVITSGRSFTTTWDTPLLNPSPSSTSTMSANTTRDALWNERIKYCWITEEDYNNGFHEGDLPRGCDQFINRYCFPDVNGPVPTSPAKIPAVCTPERATYTTDVPTQTEDNPEATPTPYQAGMIRGCKKFYLVKSGDSCSKIAASYGIAVDAFYAYNPDVGKDCKSLFSRYYVCVGL